MNADLFEGIAVSANSWDVPEARDCLIFHQLVMTAAQRVFVLFEESLNAPTNRRNVDQCDRCLYIQYGDEILPMAFPEARAKGVQELVYLIR